MKAREARSLSTFSTVQNCRIATSGSIWDVSMMYSPVRDQMRSGVGCGMMWNVLGMPPELTPGPQDTFGHLQDEQYSFKELVVS